MKLENHINEFDVYEIDYSSEDKFVKSVEKMILGLQKIMEEYTDAIDEIFV